MPTVPKRLRKKPAVKSTKRKTKGRRTGATTAKKPKRRPPKKQRPAGLAAHATGGACVTIAERNGSTWEVAHHVCSVTSKDPAGPRGGGELERRVRRPVGGGATISEGTCVSLAAVGHPMRGKILLKLLCEKATYSDLQRTTKLQAGPLYHHINQLRMAGLIGPKQRDTYELTRSGRNLIMIIAAAAPLIRNGRRHFAGKFTTRSS